MATQNETIWNQQWDHISLPTQNESFLVRTSPQVSHWVPIRSHSDWKYHDRDVWNDWGPSMFTCSTIYSHGRSNECWHMLMPIQINHGLARVTHQSVEVFNGFCGHVLFVYCKLFCWMNEPDALNCKQIRISITEIPRKHYRIII